MKAFYKQLVFPVLVVCMALTACSNEKGNTEERSNGTTPEVTEQNADQKTAAVSKGADDIRVEDGVQIYETEDFVVEAPEGWNIDLSGRMNTRMILFAPYDSTNNIFRENINMLIDPVGDSLGLDAYVAYAKGILSSQLQGFGNYRERKEEGRTWLFYDGQQQTMALHYTQMMAQKGEDIYILTFTSNASESRNESTAKDIMRAFRLKD